MGGQGIMTNHKIFFKTRRRFSISLFLAVLTLAVYSQVINYGFIDYDDAKYVYDNPFIESGINKESIFWAFTATYASNWHPLTWLSHMLDVNIFGMHPGGHHLTNVVFHIINTLLLFFILNRTTGKVFQSGFVSALFALHPLHVESVAWIAERKDVLSTMFWMLTMWGYVAFVERPDSYRYLWVVACYVLGLMAKPMLVTLPLVLLLLDYWPLGRFKKLNAGPRFFYARNSLLYLTYEKTPLFLLAAASCIITFFAQKAGGAVGSLNMLPFNTRIANALVSYVDYIFKMFWPFNLGVFYPHPKLLPLWQVVGAVFFIVAISLLAVQNLKTRPHLFVGWFWYLITLIPVIGLVQVGRQAMADRYTYIPLIGLFIVVVWEGGRCAIKWCPNIWAEKNQQTTCDNVILAITSVSILAFFSVVTWFQVQYWRDSTKLYEHTLDVAGSSYVIHYNLANTYFHQKKYEKAIDHFKKALEIDSQSQDAMNNLGLAFSRSNRLDEAMNYFSHAIRLDPKFFAPHNNMGNLLVTQGKLDQAIDHYLDALEIDPKNPDVHNNLGLALIRQGKIDDAIFHFQKALEIYPEFPSAKRNLARTSTIKHKLDQAVYNMQQALSPVVENLMPYSKIERLIESKKELDKAIDFYQMALSTQPGYSKDALNLNNYDSVNSITSEYLKTIAKLVRIKGNIQ